MDAATTDEKQQQQGEETPETTAGENGADTLSGEELKDLDEREPRGEGVSSTDAVQGAAKGARLGSSDQSKALQWFLKATPDRGEAETKVLSLNFGTSDEPEWVEWTIKPVQLDRMRRIRQDASNSRAAKRTGNIDEYRVNLQIVVAGTVDPNLTEAATMLHSQGAIPSNDPATALRIRFQHKPGYIAQISGEIMSLSGFTDDDVTEREQVDAAGNS